MNAKPYLIGIAGPSGAGKSYLAGHLVRELKNATVVPIDAYYPDLAQLSLEQRSELNFDDPAMLDTALLFAQVEALARGESVQQPVYDFAHHTRTAEKVHVPPSPFIIIEGLFTLYWPELRNLLHTRIYVDMSDDICLERRMARDVHERGRSPEYVEHQFRSSVVAMAEAYVRPTSRFADIKVYGAAKVEEEVAAVLAHVRRT